jgi:hypothetical protein
MECQISPLQRHRQRLRQKAQINIPFDGSEHGDDAWKITIEIE